MAQPGKDGPGVVQQHGGTVAVADVTGRYADPQQQAQGVNKEMPLAAVDLLGPVVAVPAPDR
jgi:hypothetical protein